MKARVLGRKVADVQDGVTLNFDKRSLGLDGDEKHVSGKQNHISHDSLDECDDFGWNLLLLNVVDFKDAWLVLDGKVDIRESDVGDIVVLGVVGKRVYVDGTVSVINFGYLLLADNEDIVSLL